MAACRSGEFAIAVEVSMGVAGSALAYRFYGRWLILCCSVLQADSVDLAFDCSREGLKQFRKQWPKIFQAVSRGLQHNDCNGELGDVLLKGQVTVNGDEDIKLRLSSGK